MRIVDVVEADSPDVSSGVTAKRQAEAIVRRLRAAAQPTPAPSVTGAESPILERLRRGTDHLDCWDAPVVAGRLDHRLRLALPGILPPEGFGVLAATFDGLFVILQATDGQRRRNEPHWVRWRLGLCVSNPDWGGMYPQWLWRRRSLNQAPS